MRVHIEGFLPRPDNAISRVLTALKTYMPKKYGLVDGKENADLVVVCAYGHRRHLKYYTEKLLAQKKKYAVVQLCLRSTPNPKTKDWIPIWEKAELVWSYLNLPELCKEDGNKSSTDSVLDKAKFNFYYAPLGVDSKIFKETKSRRKFIIANTGTGSRSSDECKNEVISAARTLGKNTFQLGYGERSDVAYSNGMDDKMLAYYYSHCEFVSGLRKIEGFELPVIEGLLCGARPICFDRPDSRHWFDKLAEFIPEDDNITDNVRKILQKRAKPVTDKEKKYVKSHFNWKKICKGFWRSLP